jgi:inosose dehydratase
MLLRHDWQLAASPVSWGVDFPDLEEEVESDRVLNEIAALGFPAVELGPLDFVEPSEWRSTLESHRLAAVGTWAVVDLHTRSEREATLAVARETASVVSAAGGELIIVIDSVSDVRAATAGRSGAAPRLDGAGWSGFCETVADVAAICSTAGLRAAFHPHVGTYVEFEDEVERLLSAAPDLGVELCIDTGHSAYAGIDPAQLIHRCGEAVGHVHLKDVDQAVLRRARARCLAFWDAVAAGIFCPLGKGVVDFSEVFSALASVGYERYATIEQDRDPRRNRTPPAEDLRQSCDYLRSLNEAAR